MNMEQSPIEQTATLNTPSSFCSFCHQPILPQYYFCPNCGKKIDSAPLSTDTKTQIWIYIFSIILPMICFIFVTKWPGVKYYKSKDPKTKQIGQIAWALLVISTIVTIYFVYNFTQQMIQSSINSINTDFGGL